MNKNVSSFQNRFQSYCKENSLISLNNTILVGYSGGADSTALLYNIWKLRTKFRLKIIAVHINYHLRGEESDMDEKHAIEFCFSLGVTIVVKKVSIDSETGIEEKARLIREQIFTNLSKMYKANKIALGHNQNDQAETSLFRLFRGSGLNGLGGIHPKEQKKIHPLLPFSREEIRAYLTDLNIKWRDDSSNFKSIYSRNKIRLDLVPWIESKFNPKIIPKLAEMTEIFRDSSEFMNKLALQKFKKISNIKNSKKIELDILKLQKVDKCLKFYIYAICYKKITKTELGFYHYHQKEIEKLIDSNGCKYINLPHNLIVTKEYDKLKFTNKMQIKKMEKSDSQKVIESFKKHFNFDKQGIYLKHIKTLPRKKYPFENKNVAYLDMSKIEFPLTFRYRKNGDKFKPLGMNHFKKLKDFFIDEKVPKLNRNKIVVIEDNNKIIWIVGKRIDQRVALSDSTKEILEIKVTDLSQNKKRAAKRKKGV